MTVVTHYRVVTSVAIFRSDPT